MREIKFRAWHEKNKGFIYSDIKKSWVNGWACCEGHSKNHKLEKIEGSSCYTKPDIVEEISKKCFIPSAEWQQYTGLLDKNGMEIWEGDIVANKLLKTGKVVKWIESQASFNLKYHRPNNADGNKTGWEVIGNIYEHKDLIS